MNSSQYVRAKRLWAEGVSQADIAKELGITKSAFCSVRERYREDFPIRKYYRIPDEVRDEIRELRRYGHTYSEIAKAVGVHRITVARIAKGAV